MRAERADVAVIGAGPAGSAAALVLARAGARVALVDKTAFPRDKACGDLVGPRGVQALEDLGVRTGRGGAGGRHARGRPDREVGSAALSTRPDLSGSRGRAAACRARPGAPRRRPRRWKRRMHRPRRHSAPRRRPVGGLRAVGRDQVARRRRDRRRRGDEPSGGGGRTGRRPPGAVGVRAALLPRRIRRTAHDRVVGGDALARLPRIRLGLPRARRSGQPRCRGRRARRPRRRRPRSPIAGRLRRCPPPLRATRSCRPPPRRPARRLAQDGDGRNHPGARPCAARGRRGRAREPAPGRGDLRGVGQRTGSRRGRARRPGRAGHPLSLVPGGSATPDSTPRTRAIQAALVRRATVVAGAGRLLTAPVVGRAVAGGWAVYWNELLDGARPGAARNTAALATAIARAATSRSRARRSVANALTAA